MSADKALRCDCGHEARAAGEAALVDAIRRHAREAHDIELSVALALELARDARVVAREDAGGGDRRKEQQ